MAKPKPSREEVLAWMADTGSGYRLAAKAFPAYTAEQIKGWVRRGGLPPPSAPKPPPSPPGVKDGAKPKKGPGGASAAPTPPGRARGGAPAAELASDDREQALQIVRDARALTAMRLAQLREAVARGDKVEFDAREAQALLNYQRAASEVIETHPGLLELANGADGGVGRAGPVAGADAVGRLRRAVRAVGPGDEG